MAVDPILRLTKPAVLDCLTEAATLVHTIVPERYKLGNNNVLGIILHSVHIVVGSAGKLFVCDKGSGDQDSKLVQVKRHYPCDVAILEDHLSTPMSLTYTERVVYLAETKGDCRFYYLETRVQLKVHKLKVAELISELQSRNLPTNAEKSVLQQHLQGHLNQQAAVNDSNTLVKVSNQHVLNHSERGICASCQPNIGKKDINIVQLLFNALQEAV